MTEGVSIQGKAVQLFQGINYTDSYLLVNYPHIDIFQTMLKNYWVKSGADLFTIWYHLHEK